MGDGTTAELHLQKGFHGVPETYQPVGLISTPGGMVKAMIRNMVSKHMGKHKGKALAESVRPLQEGILPWWSAGLL